MEIYNKMELLLKLDSNEMYETILQIYTRKFEFLVNKKKVKINKK